MTTSLITDEQIKQLSEMLESLDELTFSFDGRKRMIEIRSEVLTVLHNLPASDSPPMRSLGFFAPGSERAEQHMKLVDKALKATE